MRISGGDRTAVRKSLSRCKPGRLPVIREGERYGLDPLHDELDLWAFRLGLLPPKPERAPRLSPAPLLLADEQGALGRGEVRDLLHSLEPFALHLILERVLERAGAADLEAVIGDLVCISRLTPEEPLGERLEWHAKATLARAFREKLTTSAPHGHRASTSTAVWLARTAHLLELGVAALPRDAGLARPLQGLLEAVNAVDDSPDEYVALEDDDTLRLYLGTALDAAQRALDESGQHD